METKTWQRQRSREAVAAAEYSVAVTGDSLHAKPTDESVVSIVKAAAAESLQSVVEEAPSLSAAVASASAAGHKSASLLAKATEALTSAAAKSPKNSEPAKLLGQALASASSAGRLIAKFVKRSQKAVVAAEQASFHATQAKAAFATNTTPGEGASTAATDLALAGKEAPEAKKASASSVHAAKAAVEKVEATQKLTSAAQAQAGPAASLDIQEALAELTQVLASVKAAVHAGRRTSVIGAALGKAAREASQKSSVLAKVETEKATPCKVSKKKKKINPKALLGKLLKAAEKSSAAAEEGTKVAKPLNEAMGKVMHWMEKALENSEEATKLGGKDANDPEVKASIQATYDAQKALAVLGAAEKATEAVDAAADQAAASAASAAKAAAVAKDVVQPILDKPPPPPCPSNTTASPPGLPPCQPCPCAPQPIVVPGPVTSTPAPVVTTAAPELTKPCSDTVQARAAIKIAADAAASLGYTVAQARSSLSHLAEIPPGPERDAAIAAAEDAAAIAATITQAVVTNATQAAALAPPCPAGDAIREQAQAIKDHAFASNSVAAAAATYASELATETVTTTVVTTSPLPVAVLENLTSVNEQAAEGMVSVAETAETAAATAQKAVSIAEALGDIETAKVLQKAATALSRVQASAQKIAVASHSVSEALDLAKKVPKPHQRRSLAALAAQTAFAAAAQAPEVLEATVEALEAATVAVNTATLKNDATSAAEAQRIFTIVEQLNVTATLVAAETVTVANQTAIVDVEEVEETTVVTTTTTTPPVVLTTSPEPITEVAGVMANSSATVAGSLSGVAFTCSGVSQLAGTLVVTAEDIHSRVTSAGDVAVAAVLSKATGAAKAAQRHAATSHEKAEASKLALAKVKFSYTEAHENAAKPGIVAAHLAKAAAQKALQQAQTAAALAKEAVVEASLAKSNAVDAAVAVAEAEGLATSKGDMSVPTASWEVLSSAATSAAEAATRCSVNATTSGAEVTDIVEIGAEVVNAASVAIAALEQQTFVTTTLATTTVLTTSTVAGTTTFVAPEAATTAAPLAHSLVVDVVEAAPRAAAAAEALPAHVHVVLGRARHLVQAIKVAKTQLAANYTPSIEAAMSCEANVTQVLPIVQAVTAGAQQAASYAIAAQSASSPEAVVVASAQVAQQAPEVAAAAAQAIEQIQAACGQVTAVVQAMAQAKEAEEAVGNEPAAHAAMEVYIAAKEVTESHVELVTTLQAAAVAAAEIGQKASAAARAEAIVAHLHHHRKHHVVAEVTTTVEVQETSLQLTTVEPSVATTAKVAAQETLVTVVEQVPALSACTAFVAATGPQSANVLAPTLQLMRKLTGTSPLIGKALTIASSAGRSIVVAIKKSRSALVSAEQAGFHTNDAMSAFVAPGRGAGSAADGLTQAGIDAPAAVQALQAVTDAAEDALGKLQTALGYVEQVPGAAAALPGLQTVVTHVEALIAAGQNCTVIGHSVAEAAVVASSKSAVLQKVEIQNNPEVYKTTTPLATTTTFIAPEAATTAAAVAHALVVDVVEATQVAAAAVAPLPANAKVAVSHVKQLVKATKVAKKLLCKPEEIGASAESSEALVSKVPALVLSVKEAAQQAVSYAFQAQSASSPEAMVVASAEVAQQAPQLAEAATQAIQNLQAAYDQVSAVMETMAACNVAKTEAGNETAAQAASDVYVMAKAAAESNYQLLTSLQAAVAAATEIGRKAAVAAEAKAVVVHHHHRHKHPVPVVEGETTTLGVETSTTWILHELLQDDVAQAAQLAPAAAVAAAAAAEAAPAAQEVTNEAVAAVENAILVTSNSSAPVVAALSEARDAAVEAIQAATAAVQSAAAASEYAAAASASAETAVVAPVIEDVVAATVDAAQYAPVAASSAAAASTASETAVQSLETVALKAEIAVHIAKKKHDKKAVVAAQQIVQVAQAAQQALQETIVAANKAQLASEDTATSADIAEVASPPELVPQTAPPTITTTVEPSVATTAQVAAQESVETVVEQVPILSEAAASASEAVNQTVTGLEEVVKTLVRVSQKTTNSTAATLIKKALKRVRRARPLIRKSVAKSSEASQAVEEISVHATVAEEALTAATTGAPVAASHLAEASEVAPKAEEASAQSGEAAEEAVVQVQAALNFTNAAQAEAVPELSAEVRQAAVGLAKVIQNMSVGIEAVNNVTVVSHEVGAAVQKASEKSTILAKVEKARKVAPKTAVGKLQKVTDVSSEAATLATKVAQPLTAAHKAIKKEEYWMKKVLKTGCKSTVKVVRKALAALKAGEKATEAADVAATQAAQSAQSAAKAAQAVQNEVVPILEQPPQPCAPEASTTAEPQAAEPQAAEPQAAESRAHHNPLAALKAAGDAAAKLEKMAATARDFASHEAQVPPGPGRLADQQAADAAAAEAAELTKVVLGNVTAAVEFATNDARGDHLRAQAQDIKNHAFKSNLAASAAASEADELATQTTSQPHFTPAQSAD